MVYILVVNHVKIIEHMYRILVLILLTFSIGCQQPIRKDRSKSLESEFYIANYEFEGISNKIGIIELDSLIESLPSKKLMKDQNYSQQKNEAISIIEKQFMIEKLDPKYFFIENTKAENDSVVEFYLQHLDYFVYKNNLEKKNLELAGRPDKDGSYEAIPPITGNLNGHEGWYRVNTRNKKITIRYAQ